MGIVSHRHICHPIAIKEGLKVMQAGTNRLLLYSDRLVLSGILTRNLRKQELRLLGLAVTIHHLTR